MSEELEADKSHEMIESDSATSTPKSVVEFPCGLRPITKQEPVFTSNPPKQITLIVLATLPFWLAYKTI